MTSKRRLRANILEFDASPGGRSPSNSKMTQAGIEARLPMLLSDFRLILQTFALIARMEVRSKAGSRVLDPPQALPADLSLHFTVATPRPWPSRWNQQSMRRLNSSTLRLAWRIKVPADPTSNRHGKSDRRLRRTLPSTTRPLPLALHELKTHYQNAVHPGSPLMTAPCIYSYPAYRPARKLSNRPNHDSFLVWHKGCMDTPRSL
jgi:hypothetical protein